MVAGIIERIRYYPAKGAAGIDLAEGRFIENAGLEGDCHAKGGGRQVSLLFAGEKDASAPQDRRLADSAGLCFSRYRENISIRGLVPAAPGTYLAAGDIILLVTEEVKHCHAECALYKAGESCALAGLNLFARVVRGGIARAGDAVTVKKLNKQRNDAVQ